MFEISDKIQIAKDTFSVWVEAPKIVENAKPGQFVIVMGGGRWRKNTFDNSRYKR